jgi:hypothetical protein
MKMNNVKEKAKELIEKFYSKYNNVRKDKKYSKEQIRMALICVDEIIASSPSLPILSDNGSFGSDIEESTNWWKEVREEILSF